MQIPLQITLRGLAQSPALDEHIRKRFAALERIHPRITSCRVTVGRSRTHNRLGRNFDVRIDVRIPGHVEIVVNQKHDDDVYVAVGDAFDAATRKIAEADDERREGPS